MKKFICLLLCLMMLIPAAVSSAGGPQAVGTVTVTLPILKAGTSTMQPPDVTLPSERNYDLTGTYWLTDDYAAPLSYPIQFVAGKTYNIGIQLHSREGRWFIDPDPIIVKNGMLASDYHISLYSEDLQFVAKVTIPAEPTEKVALNKIKGVKLTAVSHKKLKLTWKKLTKKERKKIQKIQIQVSTDKKFTKIVKKKLLKNTKASCVIPGLKRNTKYWVRIRAYRKSGNIIYVSKWTVKAKKTKK